MVANKKLTVRHLFRIKTASCLKKSSDFSCSIPNFQLITRNYILPNTLGFRVFFWFIEKIRWGGYLYAAPCTACLGHRKKDVLGIWKIQLEVAPPSGSKVRRICDVVRSDLLHVCALVNVDFRENQNFIFTSTVHKTVACSSPKSS